jgi:Protein of unknown function (DUF3617)
MRLASVIVLAAFAAGSAHAADGVKAGKWEFSAEIQVPKMPKLPPGVTLPSGVQFHSGGLAITRISCVDAAAPIPADLRPPNQQHGQCKVAKLNNNGGTVTWETACPQSDGSVAHMDGVAHYTGNTMEATMKTRVSGATGGASETTQHITGHYLGPCDGK